VGANATAAYANSASFGAGAETTRPNQQSFGTASNTYTMPGITSGASRAAQSGLTQFVTSDRAGNMATDGGATYKAISMLQAGVAVAMASAPPTLTPGEKFGIKLGWGTFGSYGQPSYAVAASAVGIVAENILSSRNRLAVTGSVGVGFSDFMGYKENAVAGGSAGLQLTW
jgi:hypothetical protein